MPIFRKFTNCWLAATPLVCAAQEPPKFLTPLPAFSIGNYDRVVFQKLIQGRAECWMIAYPSFHPEYMLCITFDEKSGIYSAVYSAPTKMIWQSHPFGVIGEKPVSPNSPRVKVLKATLPNPMASQILEVWKSVTRNTRYTTDYSGVDGIAYHFAYKNQYFGRAWCPEAGEPKLLSEIGAALVEFVKAHPGKRQEHLDNISKLVNSYTAMP